MDTPATQLTRLDTGVQDHQRLTDRKAGLVVPLFSLPSAWGIGSLGRPAIRFLDDLQTAGFSLWQLLPLGPVG
ncbi:4-alpha-glucanotransferase, partial [Faecalibaculum rodentium]